jgi:hypothetical protein
MRCWKLYPLPSNKSQHFQHNRKIKPCTRNAQYACDAIDLLSLLIYLKLWTLGITFLMPYGLAF